MRGEVCPGGQHYRNAGSALLEIVIYKPFSLIIPDAIEMPDLVYEEDV